MRRRKTNHLKNVKDGLAVLMAAAIIVFAVALVLTVLHFLLQYFLWKTAVAIGAIVSILVTSYTIGYLLNTDDVLKKAYKRIVNSVQRIF